MSRKIILNLAMSLDGFIADEDGGYDWIKGDGNSKYNTKDVWDFSKFMEQMDIVVMGRTCYDQSFHEDFTTKQVYVATTNPPKDYDNIHFISTDICRAISDLKEQDGKDIFLFGGGKLIDSFMKENIIDEYIFGIIPIILGKGRPLFYDNNPKVNLSLKQYYTEDGIIIMHYTRRV